ncbi:helix-turn-helix domain-containing protein [Saccharibacillus brassicae]|uniref:Helix-turn-helix domain-containing protein n=1 Tax=Saccharibacillus brassicae TaxID=2583377 RepID=A0A4Y6UZX5_SACBS|nr:helix-turn-helix domain-containing protein [Saccharibacillus brassicae]QDH21565.1 helix-turn-helix domain-containing protein [Saccharibacillus brassicae]
MLHLEGRALQEIADILHQTRQTIGEYVCRYPNGGLSKLKLYHSPGKPLLHTPQKKKQLAEALKNQIADDLGFEVKGT